MVWLFKLRFSLKTEEASTLKVSFPHCKIQIFWEDHKSLKKICLLRISELDQCLKKQFNFERPTNQKTGLIDLYTLWSLFLNLKWYCMVPQYSKCLCYQKFCVPYLHSDKHEGLNVRMIFLQDNSISVAFSAAWRQL